MDLQFALPNDLIRRNSIPLRIRPSVGDFRVGPRPHFKSVVVVRSTGVPGTGPKVLRTCQTAGIVIPGWRKTKGMCTVNEATSSSALQDEFFKFGQIPLFPSVKPHQSAGHTMMTLECSGVDHVMIRRQDCVACEGKVGEICHESSGHLSDMST